VDPKRDAGPDPGQLVRFAGHTASIRFVTFSADGRRALTGSSGQVLGRGDSKLEAKTDDDRSARVWDVATGREVARFNEHTQGIACGAISPDGSVAATADGAIVRVWTVSDKAEQKYEFKDSPQPIVALTFSSDGRRLASGERTSSSAFGTSPLASRQALEDDRCRDPRAGLFSG
jgi:WD40 repeat protein